MTTSCQSSDLKNASALIATGRNRINSISLLGDGTNACTLTVYDNTSATGKVVSFIKCRATDQQNHIIFTNPVSVESGIYASLGGTGGNFIVYFGG